MRPLQFLTFVFTLCIFFHSENTHASVLRFESIDYGTVGSPLEGAIPPGQTGDVYLTIVNTSVHSLRDLNMQGRAGTCVESISGNLTQEIMPGNSTHRFGPFRVSINANCDRGAAASILFVGTYRDAIEQVNRSWVEIPFSVQPFPVAQFTQSNIGIAINDNSTSEFAFVVRDQLPIVDVTLSINIQHTYIGDLTVYLEHVGSGRRAELHNQSGGSSDNIVRTWGRNGDPLPALSNLHGLDSRGDWKLVVRDSAGGDIGHIESLSLSLYAN